MSKPYKATLQQRWIEPRILEAGVSLKDLRDPQKVKPRMFLPTPDWTLPQAEFNTWADMWAFMSSPEYTPDMHVGARRLQQGDAIVLCSRYTRPKQIATAAYLLVPRDWIDRDAAYNALARNNPALKLSDDTVAVLLPTKFPSCAATL